MLRDPLLNTENDPRPFKTSIVFSLGDGPGQVWQGVVIVGRQQSVSKLVQLQPFMLHESCALQLFKALAVFALRDLDVLKIESRPQRSNPVLLPKGAEMRFTEFNYLVG